MFWKYNSQSTSQIDALLDKADVGLTEVLEQEDIIQECKNQNRKLVDYLVNPDILSELIGLIITEPSKEIEESARFRLPHIAAEILSCEVPQINEQVSSDEHMLKKLYSFLEQEPPLNPLLSSFFSKAFGVLITRKSEQNWYNYQRTCIQVFEFLKKKDFVNDILRHIGTSAIPDLVLRLITCVEGTDIKQTLLDWLNEKRLVQETISLLDSKAYGRDVHDNASRLLIELLRVSRDGQFLPASERCDDPLLAVLESPSIVHLLLHQMFMHIKCSSKLDKMTPDSEQPISQTSSPPKEDTVQDPPNEEDDAGGGENAYPDEACESVLVNGISVLLAILETRKAVSNSFIANDYLDACGAGIGGGSGEGMGGMLTAEEISKHQGQLNQTVNAMIPRLSDITLLLTNPPLKPELKTTSGTLNPPFGATRLSVVKLVCALLSTNIYEINVQLKNLKTIDMLLDLFFKYSLNNFLHAQVEQCITFLFTWNPQPQIPDSLAVENEDEIDKSAMIVESSQQESLCFDNQEDKKLEGESEKDLSLSKKEDMEDDLDCKTEDSEENNKVTEKKSTLIELKNAEVNEEEEEERVDKLLLNCPSPPGEILSCEENYEHIKGDEEMNEEDEKTHTNDSDDTNDSDGANMNDEEANPDLEWETTALAEAKKLAEIKSDIPYENPLLMHLYTDCRIVDRVVKAWEENESEEPRRKGYMGHLTRIANIMQHHTENKTLCHDFVIELMETLPESTRTGWESFVTGKLAEINEKNTIIPATSYSAGTTLTSSEDDDSDFREIQFQSESLQQIFSDYQMQQMSDNFIDSFGFNDEEFNDGDDAGGSGSMKRLASINFGLDEVTGSPSSNEDEKEQRDLFEVVCKQRFSEVHEDDMDKSKENISDDSEETATEEDDPWESRTKEIEFGSNLFSSEAPASTNSERVQSHVSDSTSDIESPLKSEKTETTEYVNANVNNITNEFSESDSSDDDIIIDRTEETSVKTHLQPSEDSNMEIDVAQQNDDPWESMNDHSQPSEVAPIDMDTTANPWESAAAASSPTPASAFDSFEFPSGSPQSTSVATTTTTTTTLSEKEPNTTPATNDAGWANFSAFDQTIQPAANPLLVSSSTPSNMLAESCSDALVTQTKNTELEQNDDLNSHKAKAARALEADNLSDENSDIMKNAVPNILNETEEPQTPS